MRLPDSRFSLTTEPERFNDLAWDLLLGAQEEARRWRHGEMDVEHLVLALLDEQRLRPLLNTLRLQGGELRDDLEDFCARQPTRSSNTLYVGDDLELLLDVAEQERQQLLIRLAPHRDQTADARREPGEQRQEQRVPVRGVEHGRAAGGHRPVRRGGERGGGRNEKSAERREERERPRIVGLGVGRIATRAARRARGGLRRGFRGLRLHARRPSHPRGRVRGNLRGRVCAGTRLAKYRERPGACIFCRHSRTREGLLRGCDSATTGESCRRSKRRWKRSSDADAR